MEKYQAKSDQLEIKVNHLENQLRKAEMSRDQMVNNEKKAKDQLMKVELELSETKNDKSELGTRSVELEQKFNLLKEQVNVKIAENFNLK